MKINSQTLIQGKNVCLVPYYPHHVQRYHEWMQSAELRAQTASEALTLSQEYQMQQSWQQDQDKCTFIILDKQSWEDAQCSEIDSMVGDVNLFFNDADDPHAAEIEIMIAEGQCRRKGFGSEALQAMMFYGITKLNVQRFVAKIGLDNNPSIHLFSKLGYEKISINRVFEEMTLQFSTTTENINFLNDSTDHLKISEYHHVH